MNKAGRKSGGNPWARVSFQERLLAKVDTNGPLQEDGTRCWVWLGHKTAAGYGCFIYREGRRLIDPSPTCYERSQWRYAHLDVEDARADLSLLELRA